MGGGSDRSEIEALLVALNDAENRHDPAGIDLAMAEQVEGWKNDVLFAAMAPLLRALAPPQTDEGGTT